MIHTAKEVELAVARGGKKVQKGKIPESLSERKKGENFASMATQKKNIFGLEEAGKNRGRELT